jgi:hypothetical protein
VWRGEQAVDEGRIGVFPSRRLCRRVRRARRRLGSRRSDKLVNFFRSRRQAKQIERGAANEGARVGFFHGLKSRRLELGKNKMVDRSTRPGRLLDLRRRMIAHRLERPELPILVANRPWRAHRPGRPGDRNGPRDADGQPMFQGLDFVVGQLTIGGHLQIAGVVDHRNQQTFVGLAGDGHRATLAPGQ